MTRARARTTAYNNRIVNEQFHLEAVDKHTQIPIKETMTTKRRQQRRRRKQTKYKYNKTVASWSGERRAEKKEIKIVSNETIGEMTTLIQHTFTCHNFIPFTCANAPFTAALYDCVPVALLRRRQKERHVAERGSWYGHMPSGIPSIRKLKVHSTRHSRSGIELANIRGTQDDFHTCSSLWIIVDRLRWLRTHALYTAHPPSIYFKHTTSIQVNLSQFKCVNL